VPALVNIASRADCVIEFTAAVGHSVLDSTPILRVLGEGGLLPEAHLRSAIDLGGERTFEQDPKYAIRLLVDIAIKALSPAINDPTTAVQALDQIEDLLLRLGRRRLEIGAFRDSDTLMASSESSLPFRVGRTSYAWHSMRFVSMAPIVCRLRVA
jgi:uncharacterized membrane protein